ncbi:cellulase-domain-containing protein [Rickenella mellea]|uniref:cellulase n=1 Tax=Rickenella mellea TaxID=50990 RepID=A0A4Y7Q3G9_9AGAM|nr:cellulase-domain-containing protein [Rickenella mellea]
MISLRLSALLALASFVSAQQPVYGQCGGINWTGGTTCAAGSVCTYSGPYYSQCLPGSNPPPTTKPPVTTPTKTSTSTAPTQTSGGGGGVPPAVPFMGGVNTAGYDFTVYTNGSFSGVGYAPPPSQFTHFAGQGVKLFRVPFAWQLMTPQVGGTIDPNFWSRYDATVQQALASGPNVHVILDLHNYARWNNQIIAQGGPTNAQFTSLWSQIAQKYAGQSRVIFGIMNEPHDIPSVATWVTSVQAAVNAIRAAGATSQFILMPGSSWSSAAALPTEAGPLLLGVTDPAGGKSKLLFDVHKYLDSDNSGTHPDCVTNNIDTFTALVTWLKANGRQAILSETGGGNTASCETMLGQELAYVKSQSQYIVGYTIWAAGAFDTTYTLTVTPNANGSDQPLWTIAVRPNL